MPDTSSTFIACRGGGKFRSTATSMRECFATINKC